MKINYSKNKKDFRHTEGRCIALRLVSASSVAMGILSGPFSLPARGSDADTPSSDGVSTGSADANAAKTDPVTRFFTSPYQTTDAVFGFQSIGGRGSEWKFKQYDTPQSLPQIQVFDWRWGGPEGALSLSLHQPGWTDQDARFEYRHGDGSLTRVYDNFTVTEFHPDLTIHSAQRKDQDGGFTWQASPNGARIRLDYRTRDLSRNPLIAYPDFRATDVTTDFALPSGRWLLAANESQRRIDDRGKSVRRTSRSETASLQYQPAYHTAIRASASALDSRSDANGTTPLVSAKGSVLALDVVSAPTTRVTIRGNFRSARYSRTATGVGYQSGEDGGQVDVKYAPDRRWMLRAGWRSRTIRFHNREELIDKPKTVSSWIGGAYRFGSRWELTGQTTILRLSGDPVRVNALPDGTPILQTSQDTIAATGDLSPLAPDRIRQSEAKLSAPLPHYGGLTATWHAEDRDNRFRVLDYKTEHRDLTFWIPFEKGWTLAGSVGSDKMSGSQAYLKGWLSNDSIVTGSITGPLTNRLSLNLSATQYRVSGGYPARSAVYSATARRRMNAATDIEIGIERESFMDEVDAKNTFRATMLVTNLRTRF